MPGQTAAHRLAMTALVAVGALALAACAGAPSKAAPAGPVAVATAPVACQEEPGQRIARVAGGGSVNLTTCARPAAEWAAKRPGIDALRPHLNP